MIINLYKTQIPLSNPYFLSFGTVNSFDTFFCSIETKGNIFWGESTALFGYSWENSKDIWVNLQKLCKNKTVEELKKNLEKERDRNPFAISCIQMALDKMNLNYRNQKILIPLVGIISSSNPDIINKELFNQINSGFKTIKIKVSGNLKNDIAKLKYIQSILPKNVKIRIDANQAYSEKDSIYFVKTLNPEKVELFEQPYSPNQWKQMAKLNSNSPVPLMLDESIWTKEDILKTKELKCADYVKLKLFKHGSINNTIKLIEFTKELGLNIVFGNGVQSTLGCFDEAQIYYQTNISTAFEGNGFLKQKIQLDTALEVNNGVLNCSNSLDWKLETFSDFIKDQKQFTLN